MLFSVKILLFSSELQAQVWFLVRKLVLKCKHKTVVAVGTASAANPEYSSPSSTHSYCCWLPTLLHTPACTHGTGGGWVWRGSCSYITDTSHRIWLPKGGFQQHLVCGRISHLASTCHSRKEYCFLRVSCNSWPSHAKILVILIIQNLCLNAKALPKGAWAEPQSNYTRKENTDSVPLLLESTTQQAFEFFLISICLGMFHLFT